MADQATPYQGAEFYKCALQVNPYSYAKCQGNALPDETTYNRQILEKCQQEDIQVVGLADHGKVEDSEELRTLLISNRIIVFPGFEIASSEKIHMVCLYPEDTTVTQLNQHLGVLAGSNANELKGNPTHPSSLSCQEIAKRILDDQHGFWYAAHMTGRNGLLKLTGRGDNYVQIWKEEKLVIAGQIPGTVNDLIGTEQNDLEKYRLILENKNPDYKRERPIAIINAKDIGKAEDLSDSSASCQIKMTRPDFEAFKQAFHDPESRVRLNHDIPKQPYSVIESIQWQGGFFKENGLAFSEHLNAIIGGRGVGKSTLIEGIRFVLGVPIRGEDKKEKLNLRKDNLSGSQVALRVRSKTQNGNVYTISRRYGEESLVTNDQGEISNLSPNDILPEVEILGQNEILAIEKDKDETLKLASRFLPDIEKFDEDIREIQVGLEKNRNRLIDAVQEHETSDARIAREPKLREQAEQFRKLGIEDKLKNVRLIQREQDIQESVDEQIRSIDTWLNDYQDVFELSFLQHEDIKNLPNKKAIESTKRIFEKLKDDIDRLVKQASESVQKAGREYTGVKSKWDGERRKIDEALSKAISQLPSREGKTGSQLGAQYQTIVQELTKIERVKKVHQNQKTIVNSIKAERAVLLEEYRGKAFNRFHAVEQSFEKINDKLKGKLKISIQPKGNIDGLKSFLRDLEGIGKAKTEWLDEAQDELDLVQWSKWIMEKNVQSFIDAFRSQGMPGNVADKLCDINLEQRLRLEEIELKDTVEIQLNIAHEDADERFIPLDSLSTGQKCTAILNLLLLSRDDPLIIDQPEDNLDNAFIADRIVQDLRKFKTNRQFLFATHNANIPVFGDAELIVVLDSDKEGGRIENQGSIDKPDVQAKAADILEGGKAAFDMRKRKYGF